MKYFFKVLFIFLSIINCSLAYEINDKVIYQKDFQDKTIYLPLNNYRTLIFDSRIKNIQLTNSDNISADFIDNNESPLTRLKILGKNIGNEGAIVTLENGESIHINFSIMQNLDTIISIVKSTYPDIIIEQANDTIILKGYVKDYREKDLVIDTFKKAGIKTDEKLVDIIETSTPSKMIRVKLYVVEIDNDDGIDIKNNWAVSSRNYQTYTFYDANNDREFDATVELDSVDNSNRGDQHSQNITDAIDNIMVSAVSLTGGLSGAANYLGKYFNTSLVLQYLSSEGVANVLDETTLITLENKEATFHAGGTIRIKTQTTTAEGVPSTDVEKVKYGLQLKIKAKNVMKNNYVDLEITTSNTKIDWTNTVDDIPSFLENEVLTNVLARNGSTIVLGGLLSEENSYDADKIPLIGDIPVLGKLFSSEAFRQGKSELVFFLTPEIVDPAENNQLDSFRKTRKKVLDTSKYKEGLSWADSKYDKKEDTTNKSKKEENTIFGITYKSKENKLSPKEKHQKRVNQILGYE
ncbi:type II and III secretion system protein [Halarcobacter sp.]|uniref:type II and III secretion system protein n=1 Tax=Halarcobacter sp. TaxID=2321133 RepID=UPI002AAC0DD4|nr:type II and III secretion system protein [Halarcobacter sp.]